MRETAFPLGVLYPDRIRTIASCPEAVFDAAGAESRAELTVTESNARWCPTRASATAGPAQLRMTV